MAVRLWLASFALLNLSAATVLCQQKPSTSDGVSTVQPGAPGKPSKTLPSDAGPMPMREPSAPDVAFMQGMIMHHNQAVEMTAMIESRSHNPEVLELGKKISISQTDEMGFMKRWLQDHGKPTTMEMPGMDHMAGMDMSSMQMPMMPGMLTEDQMKALRNSTGATFDHLFLTGMIQHHTGALSMVKDLFRTPGAAQDPLLFDFTSDVDNTQQAEIDTMRHMLAKEKQ
jgi:uncharacterized protein (DUF305 family)